MKKSEIIEKTKEFAKNKLSRDKSGHDFWHTLRVYEISKQLAKKEKADIFIVEMAALLHDVFDWKFYDEKTAKSKINGFLNKFNLDRKIIDHILHIVLNISFKGAAVKNKIKTIEGKIVQDADRLDTVGAIAIARTFAYGGYKNIPIYNPNIKPMKKSNEKEYRKQSGTSINHFYDKLLLLKDLMNTKTAKKIAIKRHKILENYLKEFFKEWEAKL